MSAISAYRAYAAALTAAGNDKRAASVNATAAAWVAELRASQPAWYTQAGVHAAGDALRAGFCNETERAYLAALFRSDPDNVYSMSGFNAYYMLEGIVRLGVADVPAIALGLIERNWGTMVNVLNASCTWERFDPQAASFLRPGDPPLNSLNDRTSEVRGGSTRPRSSAFFHCPCTSFRCPHPHSLTRHCLFLNAAF